MSWQLNLKGKMVQNAVGFLKKRQKERYKRLKKAANCTLLAFQFC